MPRERDSPGQWHSRQAVRFAFVTPMVLISSMLAMRIRLSATLSPSTTIASGHLSCAYGAYAQRGLLVRVRVR